MGLSYDDVVHIALFSDMKSICALVGLSFALLTHPEKGLQICLWSHWQEPSQHVLCGLLPQVWSNPKKTVGWVQMGTNCTTKRRGWGELCAGLMQCAGVTVETLKLDWSDIAAEVSTLETMPVVAKKVKAIKDQLDYVCIYLVTFSFSSCGHTRSLHHLFTTVVEYLFFCFPRPPTHCEFGLTYFSTTNTQPSENASNGRLSCSLNWSVYLTTRCTLGIFFKSRHFYFRTV